MPETQPYDSAPVPPQSGAAPDAPTAGSLGFWSNLAICAGEDPDIFFPGGGAPGTRARQICASCPVREDCLDYAIQADEYGIWGGLDQEQRRTILIDRTS